MATFPDRFLGRTLRDVTSVKPEDLRSECPAPHLVLTNPDSELLQEACCQVICVASGKGGTGKTFVSANLAVLLARAGLKVLLLDADMGLANAHLMLGENPEGDVSQVIAGGKKLVDVVVECEAGVKLISGGSGFSDLADLKDDQLRCFAGELKVLENASDVMLVDLSAGISPQVRRFLSASHEVLLVTTPDVTAMLDAYATIKVISETRSDIRVNMIVNRARDRGEAVDTFKRISAVQAKNLSNAPISFLGWVPQSWYAEDSVFKRYPAVLLHPKSHVTACLRQIADRIKSLNREWAGNAEKKARPASFSSKLMQMVFE